MEIFGYFTHFNKIIVGLRSQEYLPCLNNIKQNPGRIFIKFDGH